MKRARACNRKLRTCLGRVIRDIERKCPEPDESLQSLLSVSISILTQKRHDKHRCTASMNRNRLKGIDGDRINAILSAAGINLRKLLKF